MAKKLLSVAKSWLGSSPEFDTYIPSLADAANIEDAFKLFMYGTADNGGAETVQATSLYSSLLSIKNTAESADDLSISHSSASINVHGLSDGAAVVGTTSTQTLTNKTLENPTISSINGSVSVSGNLSVSGNIIGHTEFNSQSSSSYTLSLSDDSKIIQMSNSSANTVTVPLNSSVAFPVGTQIMVVQYGVGQTSIAASDPSITINSTPGLKLRAQWSSATLIKTATNTWLLLGDLTA